IQPVPQVGHSDTHGPSEAAALLFHMTGILFSACRPRGKGRTLKGATPFSTGFTVPRAITLCGHPTEASVKSSLGAGSDAAFCPAPQSPQFPARPAICSLDRSHRRGGANRGNFRDESWFGAVVSVRTVLVLEDEPLIRRATAEILADAGHNVLQAQSGVEALACLNEHAVDVIVADINLPGKLTGLELGMLALLALPRLKLVVTSGGNAPDAARMPPNSVFLAKPYRPQEICAAVEA
ncbi:MAG: response regulator, partial [Sphingomonas bacterium]